MYLPNSFNVISNLSSKYKNTLDQQLYPINITFWLMSWYKFKTINGLYNYS